MELNTNPEMAAFDKLPREIRELLAEHPFNLDPVAKIGAYLLTIPPAARVRWLAKVAKEAHAVDMAFLHEH